jgi:hypothetical protein
MTRRDEEPLYGELLAVGAQVSSWVVERTHASGPVSTLYRARDVRTGAPAALKVTHARVAAASTALRRFQREAATLQHLRHPHIVGILEYGALPDGRPFIAMEWLEGGDLAAELAARGPLSPGEALEVLEQVGAALEAAHRAGVVHRDLKAQNVVRLAGGGEAPRVKLVDFGIAKGLFPGAPGDSALTHTGSVLGTPLSMAPEQIRGERPDVRTDLYALGVLLFQLVTGRPPFLGVTQHEVEEQHLHTPPPRASEYAPVPAALDEVVRRCMAKRREDRYPNVAAVLEDLRNGVRGLCAPTQVEQSVALYLEARREGALDDEALEWLDLALTHVAKRVRDTGLEVKVDGAGCLLAVAPLRGDELEARARVLEAALTLVEERVGLAAIVHVGEGLLRLPQWVVPAHRGGLRATEAALRGLEAHFHLEPVPGAPGLRRVARKVTAHAPA